MAWIWMVPAAGAVLLWAVSLRRILSAAAPYSLPPSPRFPPPLRGDRRSRNVLLVLAHPDDESMYVSHHLLYSTSCMVCTQGARRNSCPASCLWSSNWNGKEFDTTIGTIQCDNGKEFDKHANRNFLPLAQSFGFLVLIFSPKRKSRACYLHYICCASYHTS
jgi:hypothetical protein